MANPISYAINEIGHQIPSEILRVAMTLDEQPELTNLTTVDDKLLRKVLRKRVLVDANITGGVELLIPLNTTPPTHYEHNYTIYSISPELTMNREIISTLGLSALPGNTGFGMPHGGVGLYGGNYNDNPVYGNNFNPLMSVANRIGDSASIGGPMHNAQIEIIGYNTILVYAHYRLLAHLGLRVIVENDNNLNNIQPRSYKDFATLCVLATKAYIYNKLVIPMNSGFLAGGQDLGMFKSIVDNYSSSEEDYNVFLREVWSGVAYMNDTGRYSRMLNSMIAPDL